MWRPDHELLAKQLSDYFGIQFEGAPLPSKGSYPAFELYPVNCAPMDAFRIVVRTQWRSLQFEFKPGAYAGELVLQMGRAAPGRIELFVELARRCRDQKAQVTLSVNGSVVGAEEPAEWPQEWQRAELLLSKSPAAVNTENSQVNDAEVDAWSRRFVGLVLALVPVEEDSEENEHPENVEGLPEGAIRQVLVNRYERSRINRAACIEIHGCSCQVCGFDFGEAYGGAGDGFIHVHHTTPVSELGEGYRVNPVTDLVPLCPNCHAMAHRRSPPFTLEELRGMRGTTSSARGRVSPLSGSRQ
jgi:5-methylcytosine-specific restriction protein A